MEARGGDHWWGSVGRFVKGQLTVLMQQWPGVVGPMVGAGGGIVQSMTWSASGHFEVGEHRLKGTYQIDSNSQSNL